MFNNPSFTPLVGNTVPPELATLLGTFGIGLLALVAVIIVVVVIIKNLAASLMQKARDAAELVKEQEASQLKLVQSSLRTEELKAKQEKVFAKIRQKKADALDELQVSLTAEGEPENLDHLKGDINVFVDEIKSSDNTDYASLLNREEDPYGSMMNFDSFEDAYGDVSTGDGLEIPAEDPNDPYANLFKAETMEEIKEKARNVRNLVNNNVDEAFQSAQQIRDSYNEQVPNASRIPKPRRR